MKDELLHSSAQCPRCEHADDRMLYLCVAFSRLLRLALSNRRVESFKLAEIVVQQIDDRTLTNQITRELDARKHVIMSRVRE